MILHISICGNALSEAVQSPLQPLDKNAKPLVYRLIGRLREFAGAPAKLAVHVASSCLTAPWQSNFEVGRRRCKAMHECVALALYGRWHLIIAGQVFSPPRIPQDTYDHQRASGAIRYGSSTNRKKIESYHRRRAIRHFHAEHEVASPSMVPVLRWFLV